MRQPPGFEKQELPNYVCKLKKAIYDLKQAPRARYNELSQFLERNNFKKSQADTSLFIFQHHTNIIYILVYVDDIIVIGNSSSTVLDIIKKLFALKDMRPVHYFLGVEVYQTKDNIMLSQQKYIQDILQDVKMEDCKCMSTPMSTIVLYSIISQLKNRR